MLLNPYETQLPVLPGTRMLQYQLGVEGYQIVDPTTQGRIWTIQRVFAPIPGRHLGGVRAKLMDQKGFITFCNQRDLEVMLGLVRPGSWCRWAGQDYPEPGDSDWFGFCMDRPDMCDDLHEREMQLLAENPYGLQWNAEIHCRLHLGGSVDVEELWQINNGQPVGWDVETLHYRWIKVSRDRLEWLKL